MKQTPMRCLLMAAIVQLLAYPCFGGQSSWQLDPAHTAATFAVRHMMISTVRGEFSKVTGTIQFDDADITKSTVNVSIDTSTVNTRTPDRDADLRSDHFLDVKDYPTMTFRSKKVDKAGNGKLKITGDLTIRGVTKEVVLDVEGPTGPIKDPYGNERMAISASTKINRQDFGVKWNANMDGGGVVVGDEVNITLDAEMIKQTAK